MSKAGGSKADTAVKLVLIFFISLLSFTVGTLVGGQFEKSKSYQLTLETGDAAEMAAAEGAENAAAPIAEDEIAGLEDMVTADQSPEREVASADEAVDEGMEESIAEQKVAASKSTESADGYSRAGGTGAEKAKATIEKEMKEAPARAAERLAENKSPTPAAKKAERTVSSSLPAVATSVVGKYTVQVASYATEPEARNHATRLKDKGFNAFYIPAEVNGKTWYRVSIGRFDDQKAATAHRKEVLDSQAATSAIVQKILK